MLDIFLFVVGLIVQSFCTNVVIVTCVTTVIIVIIAMVAVWMEL